MHIRITHSPQQKGYVQNVAQWASIGHVEKMNLSDKVGTTPKLI